MSKIKVSIIVPVFNPGELLFKCLDSAMNQTLSDIEILCIDDGSDDDSLNILNEYAKRDSRFKIFNQKNSGAGKARNNGLSHSKGEYVVFLDSDDWIEHDMCELLYNHAINLDVDMVLFDSRWHFDNIFPNGNSQSSSNKNLSIKGNSKDFIHFDSFKEDYNTFIFNHELVRNKVFSGSYGVIWTKFYKSSFLKENDIFFPSHKLYNDVEFHIKTMLLAKKISYFPKIFYHYNKSDHPSLQNSFVGKKEAIVFYEVMCGIRDFIIEKNFMDFYRLNFLRFSIFHFHSKLREMDKIYRADYFFKINEFFKSLKIKSDELDQLGFRYLSVYVNMINSSNYNEYKIKEDYFDVDFLNLNRYSDINNMSEFKELKSSIIEFKEHDVSDFGKYDLECNDLYMIYLQNILKVTEKEINELYDEVYHLKRYFKNLKLTTDEYYRIKENYRMIQEQNRKLVMENNELKKGFSNKLKKLF